MKLDFVKLHGLGNDFVFVDDMAGQIELTAEQVAFLCDRHFGIGADGVILVRQSPRPECAGYMHYINSDGTLAEMCGNGVRCFTKFLVDHGYVSASDGSYVADTLRGPLPIGFKVDDAGKMTFATVDMDEPILVPAEVPTTFEATGTAPNGAGFASGELEFEGWSFAFTTVSMGNPHAVTFLDDIEALPDAFFLGDEKSLETFDLNRIGAYFESHEVFPAKCNIEFVVKTTDGLAMRVYERGCGETLACGTGTCATVVAGVLTGHCGRVTDVTLRGGLLHIEWKDNNHVMMTGPAVQSFVGSVEL
ncbi:MAG: diaminopimelate epimerase [Coriobacteriia bacterium]|nr:diaminopimelate epimerase [Coriobacteriia bacterium]